MPLPPFTFAVLDTETTGLTPRKDRIFELAIVRCEGGEIAEEYESLLDIGDSVIPPVVQSITRVQTSDLEGKPTLLDHKDKIDALLKDAVIVAHNAPFDLAMLAGEGIDLRERPWIDSSMLASLVFPEIASWSLGYLSAALDLPHEPVHRALGDVHATTALMEKVWERCEELPTSVLDQIKDAAQKSPQGYTTFFTSIGAGTKDVPTWVSAWNSTATHAAEVREPPLHAQQTQCIPVDIPSILDQDIPAGAVQLASVPPTTDLVAQCIDAVSSRTSQGKTWIAVKNLEATRSMLDPAVVDKLTVIYPPRLLPNADAIAAFASQDSYTEDELTLLAKLLLYQPRVQSDAPIHGEEYEIWRGRLACSEASAHYQEQLQTQSTVLLIDHAQLITLVSQGLGPDAEDHVIIDDASMLEDTSTKAFRYACNLASLRAAAEGDAELTSFLDLFEIWLNRTQNELDVRYITEHDIDTPESKSLRERVSALLDGSLSDAARSSFEELAHLIHPEELEGRITWIESFRDEKVLQSVPMDVGNLLWDALYDRCRTTLLLPPGARHHYNAIVPPRMDIAEIASDAKSEPTISLRYAEPQLTLDRLLQFVDGKVVALIGSKRTIEQLYVKHVEALEEKGINLIAQGMSGGQGRMQAQFAEAEGPTVWMVTPWTYEGVQLPAGTVDHLWIHTIPFDHPSHTVLSRRAERFEDPFSDYFLPRTLQRLFRLLRTYRAHRKEDGDVLVMDDRVQTKKYGKMVKEYLQNCGCDSE